MTPINPCDTLSAGRYMRKSWNLSRRKHLKLIPWGNSSPQDSQKHANTTTTQKNLKAMFDGPEVNLERDPRAKLRQRCPTPNRALGRPLEQRCGPRRKKTSRKTPGDNVRGRLPARPPTPLVTDRTRSLTRKGCRRATPRPPKSRRIPHPRHQSRPKSPQRGPPPPCPPTRRQRPRWGPEHARPPNAATRREAARPPLHPRLRAAAAPIPAARTAHRRKRAAPPARPLPTRSG